VARGFALAGLLRLRGLQETKAAGELAEANRAVRRSTGQRSAALEQLAADAPEPVDESTLQAIAVARAASRARLLELDAVLAADRNRAAQAAATHQAARQELKSLEKLAEQHTEQRRQQELAREQQLLDDLPTAGGFGGGQR